MLPSRVIASAMLVLLAACSRGPPPEPPVPVFDPAGLWSFSVEVDGQLLEGTMRISGSEAEGYRGSFSSAAGDASMARVVVDGRSMSFTVPDLNSAGTLDFAGDRFTGEIDGEMGTVDIRGRRQGG